MPTSTGGGGSKAQTKKEKEKQKQIHSYNGGDRNTFDTLPWTSIVQGQVSHLPIIFTRDAE